MHESPGDLFVGLAGVQGERQYQVHHDPRREQPFPLFRCLRLGQHGIDQVPVENPGQHADTDNIRQQPPVTG